MEHKRTVILPYLCNLPFTFYKCGTSHMSMYPARVIQSACCQLFQWEFQGYTIYCIYIYIWEVPQLQNGNSRLQRYGKITVPLCSIILFSLENTKRKLSIPDLFFFYMCCRSIILNSFHNFNFLHYSHIYQFRSKIISSVL